MIHRGSTGKVLLTRGPLFYQSQRSRAAISHPASKRRFKLCRRDFISSYLSVYRSSTVRVHRVKMWGDGGWRCIEHTAPQTVRKTQIKWIWEMGEIVRHYSGMLISVGLQLCHPPDRPERYFIAMKRSMVFIFLRLCMQYTTLYHNYHGLELHLSIFCTFNRIFCFRLSNNCQYQTKTTGK